MSKRIGHFLRLSEAHQAVIDLLLCSWCMRVYARADGSIGIVSGCYAHTCTVHHDHGL